MNLWLFLGVSPASACLSVRSNVNISCYRISSKATGWIFKTLVRMFPFMSNCESTEKKKNPNGRRRPSLINFFCYRISAETTGQIRMKLGFYVRLNVSEW